MSKKLKRVLNKDGKPTSYGCEAAGTSKAGKRAKEDAVKAGRK